MRIPDMSRLIISGTFLLGTLLAASVPAFALSVPGYSGQSDVGYLSPYAWREKNGGAVNVSGSAQALYLPLTVNGGSHTVTIAGSNPGGESFYCAAIASDQFGTLTYGTVGYLNGTNAVTSSSVTVPTNGSMYVYCVVSPNGTVWSVNYNQ